MANAFFRRGEKSSLPCDQLPWNPFSQHSPFYCVRGILDGDRRWPNGNWNAFLERKNGAESECFDAGSFATNT